MQSKIPLFARQPIFDTDLKIVAHELLFRGDAVSGEVATADVLLSAFDQSVFEENTTNLPVFVNFPAQILLNVPRLDKSRLVIEVLEDVVVTKRLVAAIASLHAEGYQIALDDYVHTPEFEPLLQYADIIKLDVLALSTDELDHMVSVLRRPGRKLLAEKVETHAVYQHCQKLGMDFYQGYFFAKPNIVHGTAVGANGATVLNLLAALQQPGMSAEKLEQIVLTDAVLTFRIIKLVNSAAYKRANEIQSVAGAISMLGLRRISAFASLLSLSNLEDKPSELGVYTALRAQLCQQLGQLYKLNFAQESLFALGVLSCADAYFDQPIAELASNLPVQEEFKLALLDRRGLLGAVLKVAQNYQEGSWDSLDWQEFAAFGFTQELADEAYLNSLTWLGENQYVLAL